MRPAGTPGVTELLHAAGAEGLRTLSAQAERWRDPEWLRQGATDLGRLHGVMFDKAVRLLEGLEEPGG